MGKPKSACNAGDEVQFSGQEIFGGGHGNPLLSSSWENPRTGEPCIIVHRVAKRQTRLKQQHTCAHTHELETLHQNPGLAIGHPNLK